MERKYVGKFRSRPRVWVAAMAAGALLLGAWGCSRPFTPGRGIAETDAFFAAVRPVSHDPARLLRNAHYFQLMGRRDLALKELEEAYALHPDNLKVIDALARHYEALGAYSRSRQIYQEALARRPENPALVNNLCFSYYLEGKWPEAENCFTKALARNPKNEAARNNLGLLYCRLGKENEAYRLWKDSGGETVARNMMQQAKAALGNALDYARAASSPPAPPVAAESPPAPVAAAPQVAGPPGSVGNPVLEEKSPASAPKPALPEIPASSQVAGASGPVEAKPQPPGPQPGPVPRVGKEPKPMALPEKPIAKPRPLEPTLSVKPMAAEPKPPAKPQTAAAVPSRPESPGLAPEGRSQAQSLAASPAKTPRLTAQEVGGAKLLVLNGAGVNKLARRVRRILQVDGYKVARIGNHIDFGVDRTIIYYRPKAQRVAQALTEGHFPKASLVARDKMRPGSDVMIVLGKELARLKMAGMQIGQEGG
ncbi:MAG: tetratricopeptide repeat protein [Deltaproteobacteria bacterium]|nr:tetratricopeptide repeat protein [Deltaproteobacteria bacterium]